jgi:hypothetical protein
MRLESDGDVTVVTVEHRVLGPLDEENRSGFTAAWDRTLARLAEYAAGERQGGR